MNQQRSFELRPAMPGDLPSVAAMMNAAYRGKGDARSWSSEERYIEGERTNVVLLEEEQKQGSLILIADQRDGEGLKGVVSIRRLSPSTMYLGSLTVNPAIQNSGVGRSLLDAAEEYVARQGADTVEIEVVNVRASLIAWYVRRGYHTTAETRPFPYGDNRYGTPTRKDLAFAVLRKRLSITNA